jgi:hypothetical protein
VQNGQPIGRGEAEDTRPIGAQRRRAVRVTSDGGSPDDTNDAVRCVAQLDDAGVDAGDRFMRPTRPERPLFLEAIDVFVDGGKEP